MTSAGIGSADRQVQLIESTSFRSPRTVIVTPGGEISRNPNAGFNRLAWSNLLAQSSEQITLAAAPLVAVLLLGAGVGETGVLQTALTLPFLFFAIPAGLLADRMPRGKLMVFAELLRTASLMAVLGLILTEQLTWPLLALLGFAGVCGTVVFSVAAPALIPSLVSPQMLPAANARVELARTSAFTAGPAAGGLLVGWIGAGGAFGLAAALSGLAAALLARIEEPDRQRRTPRAPFQEIKDGIAFAYRHKYLAPTFATQFVFNTAFFVILAVFVPHAVHNLNLSASAVGVTLGMFGFGMVIGAFFAPRVMNRMRFGHVIAVGPFCGLFGSFLMLATIWLPSPLLAGFSFFLLGVGPILWIISTTTLRQAITPPELLGRVSAINILAYGARPIGSGLGALIGGLYGVEACLLTALLGFIMQACIIAVSPAVRLAHQPAMASG